MASRQAVRGLRRGVLVVYMAAAVACMIALGAAIDMTVTSSVVGGLAIIAASLILLTYIGWRVQFQLRRLRESRPT